MTDTPKRKPGRPRTRPPKRTERAANTAEAQESLGQTKTVKQPKVMDRAKAIYKACYDGKYKSKERSYPHIKRLLWEIAKIEAQLEAVEAMDRQAQAAGEDIFLMHVKNKPPFTHPHRKIEKELRSSLNKFVKALNLSLERKQAMKAEAVDKEFLDDL